MTPVQGLIRPDLVAKIGFGVVAATTFAGAFIAVFFRNIIHNVLGLALALFGVAGLFFYLGSPFLAFMELLIYVGAITITITFAIMLSKPIGGPLPERSFKKSFGAGAICVLILGLLSYIVLGTKWSPAVMRSSDWSVKAIGQMLLTKYDLVFELISLVLLVAILGAIVTARYGRGKVE